MASLPAYAVALAVGVLVGVLYGVLNVRFPAPPVVALVGLLGILVGEQVVPAVKGLFLPPSARASCFAAGCAHHLFGGLPGRGLGASRPVAPANPATSER